jgi:hypothetical protein
MTDDIKIIPVEGWHLLELRRNLKPGDIAEIAATRLRPSYAIASSVRNSQEVYTALLDDRVAAIWGHREGKDQIAHPWLVTTAEINRISVLKFARMYKQRAAFMLQTFKRLENYVFCGNTDSIRMLRLVGFTIGEPEDFSGALFRQFSLDRGG